jgi:hypothetical protein
LTLLVEKAKNLAMIRIAWMCLLAVACGRGKGVPDDQLGGLVVEVKPPAKIDVATAAGDVEELSRALASTHTAVVAALGPHAATIDTKTIVEEGGKQVSELADHAELAVGDAGSFKAVYTNSADYGREAIFSGGKLYLRPRYQRWHGRAPETPEEPAAIREQYFGAIAAIWDLVAPGAELITREVVQVAGRPGRKVELELTPTPRDNPRESVSQRRWRESRTVQNLAGEVILDAETGMPLAAKLTGNVAFTRDGRRFVMKLQLDAKITSVGTAQIAAPAEAEVVATPERKREVDDRDFLLHDIAPSIRKNPDGTAVKPATPDPAPAQSGDAKPPDKKKPDAQQPDVKKPNVKQPDEAKPDKPTGDKP